MATIVGIFDDSSALEKAIDDLAKSGLKETVLDQASVFNEIGTRPGPTADRRAASRTFKARLKDFGLPDRVIESYANHFNHDGKFVIVQTDDTSADRAMETLRRYNASQVNRH